MPIESVEDARRCVKYLQEKADDFGLDPDKIVLAGRRVGVLTFLKSGPDRSFAELLFPTVLPLFHLLTVVSHDDWRQFFASVVPSMPRVYGQSFFRLRSPSLQ